MTGDRSGLTVRMRPHGDDIAVDVIGPLTVEAGAHRLPDQLRDRLAVGPQALVLNLGSVTACDTAGIAVLVRCLAMTEARDRELVLVAVPPPVETLLREMRLWGEFIIVADDATAMRDLQRHVAVRAARPFWL